MKSISSMPFIAMRGAHNCGKTGCKFCWEAPSTWLPHVCRQLAWWPGGCQGSVLTRPSVYLCLQQITSTLFMVLPPWLPQAQWHSMQEVCLTIHALLSSGLITLAPYPWRSIFLTPNSKAKQAALMRTQADDSSLALPSIVADYQQFHSWVMLLMQILLPLSTAKMAPNVHHGLLEFEELTIKDSLQLTHQFQSHLIALPPKLHYCEQHTRSNTPYCCTTVNFHFILSARDGEIRLFVHPESTRAQTRSPSHKTGAITSFPVVVGNAAKLMGCWFLATAVKVAVIAVAVRPLSEISRSGREVK